MHVKYYYLLKLIWHAINIKGWLQREMQQHTPAAVKRQQDGGNELVLVLGACPEAASPDTGTKDTGAAPTASLMQDVQFCTTTWYWLSGCKALLIFLCSYLQLTLRLGCLQGPWRVCTLVCSADEKTDEAKIQLNLRSLPLPVVLGG